MWMSNDKIVKQVFPSHPSQNSTNFLEELRNPKKSSIKILESIVPPIINTKNMKNMKKRKSLLTIIAQRKNKKTYINEVVQNIVLFKQYLSKLDVNVNDAEINSKEKRKITYEQKIRPKLNEKHGHDRKTKEWELLLEILNNQC